MKLYILFVLKCSLIDEHVIDVGFYPNKQHGNKHVSLPQDAFTSTEMLLFPQGEAQSWEPLDQAYFLF